MLKDVLPPVPIHSTVKNNGSLNIFTGKKRPNYCYLLKISWQTALWENLQQLKINHVACISACLLVYNQFDFAAVPGNALKCFFTEDPDVHKAPKVYCQFEPDVPKKVICRARSRLTPRCLTPTHFSPQESSLIMFYFTKSPHISFCKLKEIE